MAGRAGRRVRLAQNFLSVLPCSLETAKAYANRKRSDALQLEVMPVHYLSFQKLPPRSIVPEQVVSIAPLIANDLRDEIFDPSIYDDFDHDTVEIRAAWLVERRLAAEDATVLHLVRTEDSIVWKGGETSWKQVVMTAPSEGEMRQAVTSSQASCSSEDGVGSLALRLALWIDARDAADQTDLYQGVDITSAISIDGAVIADRMSRGSGHVFLPVLTPPFQLSKRHATTEKLGGKRKREEVSTVTKFVNISRLWVLHPSRHSKREMRRKLSCGLVEIEEEIGFELDKHIWDAAIPLIAKLQADEGSYLCRAFDRTIAQIAEEVVILELGAGTGILSIYLQQWFARMNSRGRGRIFATDLESSLELIKSNKRLNGLGEQDDPCVLHLDWFDPSASTEAVLKQAFAQRDKSTCFLIVASDCSYNADSYEVFSSLLRTLLSTLARRSVPAQVLISKKHRHEDEKQLWPALSRAGLRADLLDGVDWQGEQQAATSLQRGEIASDAVGLGSYGLFEVELIK